MIQLSHSNIFCNIVKDKVQDSRNYLVPEIATRGAGNTHPKIIFNDLVGDVLFHKVRVCFKVSDM